MPEKSVVETKLEMAAEAIEARQFARSLKLSREAQELEPNLSLASLIEAISLSRLGRAKEANSAFRKASDLDPTSARIHYNFAVHLSGNNETVDALQEAEKALEYDPEMTDAQILANKMRQNLGLMTKEVKGRSAQMGPFAMLKEVRVETGNTSSMPWIDSFEPYWTVLGFFIAVCSLVAMTILLSTSGAVLLKAVMQPVPKGGGNLVLPLHGILKEISSICGWIGGVGAVVYTFLDVLNKRRSFIWPPIMFLFFCAGLTWLPLFIYMFFARRIGTK